MVVIGSVLYIEFNFVKVKLNLKLIKIAPYENAVARSQRNTLFCSTDVFY